MAIENTALDTFPKLLLHHAKQRGGHPAMRQKSRGIWRTLTWKDFAEEASAIAAALAARGVERGVHVALVGDNRPRLYTAMCAAQCLGAIAMPLYQDATAEEMVAPLQLAEATHVFAENQEQVDKLLHILPRCPALRCIVYDAERGMRPYRQPQLVAYAALLKEGREQVAAKRDVLQAGLARASGEDAAFLFLTSGTTGPAKGVVLSHASLIDRARMAEATEGLKASDVAIAYLPPGWIGQNLFGYVQSMVVGYCVCFPESSDTMLADTREIGPTYFLAPPRVLEALRSQVALRVEEAGGFNHFLYRRAMRLAQRVGARILAGEPVSLADRIAYAFYNLIIYSPLRDVLGMSSVRAIYTAGDAIDPGLLIYFRAIGINLKKIYGSTETGFFIAMQRDGEVKPDTVGRPADGVELRFTPEREILVRTPGLFRGYHRDAERTALAIDREGWFHTGDAGYLGDDGHLRFIDRLKNIGALKDGTAFMPRLIENKLKFLPYVKEAVAFGHGLDKVCVLVDIDGGAVGRWADKRDILYTGHADLASRDEVYELIAGCTAEVNEVLAQDPALAGTQIHRFAVLHKELDADDGVLTRTGKLIRSAIAERYRTLVEAMYAGRPSARHEEADVRIGDAKIAPAAPARKAA